MKIIVFENSAAMRDTWIRTYFMLFPNRESCVGGIEFPLDVHYARMTEYMMAGLATGNLDALKARQKVLRRHQRQSVRGIMLNSGMPFITPQEDGSAECGKASADGKRSGRFIRPAVKWTGCVYKDGQSLPKRRSGSVSSCERKICFMAR